MTEDNLDEKVLMGLGLGDLSPEEKQVMLKLLDERLEKRFVANLLMSLPEDKKKELDQKVEAMSENDLAGVLEEAMKIHPDAQAVLQKSAQEIVDEFKSVQAGAAGGIPPSDISKEPAGPSEQKTDAPEAADTTAEKPGESVMSATKPSELEQSMAAKALAGEQPPEPAGEPPAPAPAPESAPAPEPEKSADETEKNASAASQMSRQGLPTPDYYQPAPAPAPTDKSAEQEKTEQDNPVAPPPASADNPAEPTADDQADNPPAAPTAPSV